MTHTCSGFSISEQIAAIYCTRPGTRTTNQSYTPSAWGAGVSQQPGNTVEHCCTLYAALKIAVQELKRTLLNARLV